MARPKTIHIDPLQVLRGIADATAAKLAAIEAVREAIATGKRPRPTFSIDHPDTWLRDLERDGVEYDLPTFLGYFPTDSERIRAQQAIRGLERDELVEIQGIKARRIKLTPAGAAKLETRDA